MDANELESHSTKFIATTIYQYRRLLALLVALNNRVGTCTSVNDQLCTIHVNIVYPPDRKYQPEDEHHGALCCNGSSSIDIVSKNIMPSMLNVY